MEIIFSNIEKFFSIEVFGKIKLYNLISIIFKYIFVFIIYYFILNIIKLIYLDVRNTSKIRKATKTYLKLINQKEDIPFKVFENYFLEDKNTIGRGGDNDIILSDNFISKHHCRIDKIEDGYVLRDLNSSNGTYVNGKRVIEQVLLKNKDIISIYDIEFLFLSGDNYDK